MKQLRGIRHAIGYHTGVTRVELDDVALSGWSLSVIMEAHVPEDYETEYDTRPKTNT